MVLIMAKPSTFSPSSHGVLQTPGSSSVNKAQAPDSKGVTADVALVSM